MDAIQDSKLLGEKLTKRCVATNGTIHATQSATRPTGRKQTFIFIFGAQRSAGSSAPSPFAGLWGPCVGLWRARGGECPFHRLLIA